MRAAEIGIVDDENVAGIDLARGDSAISIALPALAGVFLLAAAAPFAKPMARYVVGRS
jgi:hypothetical protein